MKNKKWEYISEIRKLLSDVKQSILDFISFVYNTKNDLQSNFKAFKRNWGNLRNVNLDLATYHINNGNIDDAIFRLKILTFLISPNDEDAFALLAFCYLVKGKKEKTLEYINKTSPKSDYLDLKSFLNNTSLIEIPDNIRNEYRKVCAESYVRKWSSFPIYLPKELISLLFSQIEELPASCKILDLGSGAGLIAAELDYRLEKNYTIIGVDNIKELTKFTNYKKRSFYDKLIKQSTKEFLLDKHNKKYNIITSFCSLDFTRDLSKYFVKIKSLLSKNGYFAFLLQTSSNTQWNIEENNFVFSVQDIKNQLILANFEILDIKRVRLQRNIFYNIFIVK